MRRVQDAVRLHGVWLLAAAYAVAHILFPPRAYNSHAIMYALIAETRSHNTLEWFHPLYPPLVMLLEAARASLGFSGAPLAAVQRLSLLGGLVHLLLLHRLARRAGLSAAASFAGALLAATSINLWAWSMQTISYTWATALTLWALDRALALKRYDARACAVLGMIAGAAACFDTACALVALPLAADAAALTTPRERARLSASFIGSALAVVVLGYAPLILKLRGLHYEFPAGPGQFLDRLPSDIVSLMQSHSLGRQWRQFSASTAPVDAPYFLLALLHGALWWGPYRSASLGLQERRLLRMSFWLFGALASFFFICDPHNRFVYSCGILAPVLAAWWIFRGPRAWLGVAALGCALLARNALTQADYMPERNAGMDEARFVASKLGPDDLLVAASQPDWLFSYAVRDRVPVAQILWPEDANTAFAHEPFTVGPALNARISRALCSGRKAWLATDALFRSSLITPDRFENYNGRMLKSFQGSFLLDAPVISSAGQYYYPLAISPKLTGVLCAKAESGRW